MTSLDKDRMIEDLKEEVAKWRGRAVEAASRACEECDEYHVYGKNCEKCRMRRIHKEATES